MKFCSLILCSLFVLLLGCDFGHKMLSNEYPYPITVSWSPATNPTNVLVDVLKQNETWITLGGSRPQIFEIHTLSVFTNGQLLASYSEEDFQQKILSNKNGTVWVLTEGGLLLLSERELDAMQKTKPNVMK